MRTIGIFVVAILTCSCHKMDSNLNSPDNITKRYDEIFKIVDDYYKNKYEKNPQPGLTYPAGIYRSAYFFRGPLTKEQVEKELMEGFKDPLSILDIPLLDKYQDRDEFYYFEARFPMTGRKGYMLIRDNQFLGEIETESHI